MNYYEVGNGTFLLPFQFQRSGEKWGLFEQIIQYELGRNLW